MAPSGKQEKLRRAILIVATVLFVGFPFTFLKYTLKALASPSYFNLVDDNREQDLFPAMREASEHFPKTESAYFFGDFDEQEMFLHHPLVVMTFPRLRTPTARCGYRMKKETIQPDEDIIYTGAVHVVCRR